MGTEKDWYVYRDVKRWGPYTWEQMITGAKGGNIKPNDKLWHPMYPNFILANQVQGLFVNVIPNIESKKKAKEIINTKATHALNGEGNIDELEETIALVKK
jgi:hypothetical protein